MIGKFDEEYFVSKVFRIAIAMFTSHRYKNRQTTPSANILLTPHNTSKRSKRKPANLYHIKTYRKILKKNHLRVKSDTFVNLLIQIFFLSKKKKWILDNSVSFAVLRKWLSFILTDNIRDVRYHERNLSICKR